ncbi:MAG: hypothetical protein M9921_13825 [Fimbriimonadaceae bacterium]|nr:hypothetical protein [Fimbriimonadaceae bacterium]
MERHFTEQQVSDIIRRAAERQSRADTPGRVPAGISETELRRVAGELGIDAEALQFAMREVGGSTVSDTGTIRSIERVLEREIEGELPEEALAVVIEEFVPMTGLHANTVTLGRAINYTSMAGMGQCNVNVSPRNGKTLLRVKSNAFVAGVPTFLPALFATIPTLGFMLTKMDATPATKALAVILTLGVVWTGAIVGFRALVRHTNHRILELTNRTAEKMSAVSPMRGRLHETAQTAPLDEPPLETQS